MSLLSLPMFMLIRLGVFNIFQIINSLVIEMLEKEIVHIHLQTTKKRQYYRYAGKKKCRLLTGSAVGCNSRYCS